MRVVLPDLLPRLCVERDQKRTVVGERTSAEVGDAIFDQNIRSNGPDRRKLVVPKKPAVGGNRLVGPYALAGLRVEAVNVAIVAAGVDPAVGIRWDAVDASPSDELPALFGGRCFKADYTAIGSAGEKDRITRCGVNCTV